MSQVADLLNQSFAAHQEKKRNAGLINGTGNVERHPDYHAAESHIAKALRLRLEAHAADPNHLDPVWSEDLARNKGVSHDLLVGYYVTYLRTDPQSPLAQRFADTFAAPASKDMPRAILIDSALTSALDEKVVIQ